jgi:CRP-like cAMP-binding protein
MLISLSSLKKCALFKNISLNQVEYLLSSIVYKTISFDRNEIIFSRTQKADTMGIILSGSIHVQQIFPSGKVVIIATKDKSSLIGEPSIFSSSTYYPATISACEPCKILFIHKNQLLKLFLIDENIMKNYLEAVSNSMLVLKKKISILSLNSIQERISYFLIEQYNNCKGNTIVLPFSKKAWAEYMNVSRPSLSRELRKLELSGAISFDKRKIIINDIEQLNCILHN